MGSLADFVLANTIRGECKCGKCIDVGTGPDPTSQHTVDMVFFKVAPAQDVLDPDSLRQKFKLLTVTHPGEFADVNLFDGVDHSYIEVGAWIGDQGIAMQYMALGVILGVFELLTPYTVLKLPVGHPLAMQAAGAGYVSVKKRA